MLHNYYSTKEKPNYTFLGLIILFLIVISSLGYFAQVNSISSLGYDINSFQKKIDNLNIENQRMKILIAKESSFEENSDDSLIKKMNLVSISNQHYLVIPSSTLASR